MKTSRWWYVFFFLLGGIAIVAAQNMLFVKANAQSPVSENPLEPQGIQFDGRFVTELLADGTVVQRSPDGKIISRTIAKPPAHQAGAVAIPMTAASGHTYYVTGSPQDPETAKLMNEEQQATQAAQKLLAELRAVESDGDKDKLKGQLREKLVAIFDLQQKRRAAEVAKIEERLAKLKDTMKKRETSKDAIVDRRLDLLTGGVDELGWEETFPLGGPNAANSFRTPNLVPYGAPTIEGPPLYNAPATTVPRPANVPALPVPSTVPPATPALPGAPAPPGFVPFPAPAAPRTESELPPATTTAPRR